MKYVFILLIVAVVLTVRISMLRRRRRGRDDQEATEGMSSPRRFASGTGLIWSRLRSRDGRVRENPFGDVGLVAQREIKERVRGRIFRVGTLLILVAVGAAIIIPALHRSNAPTTQTVGVVGTLSAQAKDVIFKAGSQNQDHVVLVSDMSLNSARADLRSGKLDFVIVDSDHLLLNMPADSNNSPADPALVQDVADYLGVLQAFQEAKLTPAQQEAVSQTKAIPVQTIQPSSRGTTKGTSVVGLILLFFMLTQYNTWILIGVMQEKSSRVVEVLLAALRPIQLLGGKVLGIGLVALGQAAAIVGFALIVAAAVGSDLLHGTATLVLICQLIWLILGYAFYCWVYAAAGSMAERQDQVQTLALPLSIPILLGYIFAITVASSGNADVFFKVLAYLPPTAPFCMPVLVGLSQVTWWEFALSMLISIAGTAGMAIIAARIYRRAVLRTGRRVHIRELLSPSAR